jgi:glutathione S-transferase
MWNRRMEHELLAAVAAAFRHLHPAMAKLEVPQVKAWGEANKPKAQTALAGMNEVLGQRRYIAGEGFSVADITALCAVDFMRLARIERPAGLAHLERWHGEVSGRPSAKA